MSKKDSNRLLIAWALVVACLLFLALTGCKVLKGKQEKTAVTTKADSSSSGSVTKTSTNSMADWEWHKTTLQYLQQPKGGDTIINKNYYTSNLPQPQVIIMEGGKGKEQTATNSSDSNWHQMFGLLVEVLKESKKTKETEPATMTQILLIGLGVVVVSVVLSRLRIGK